jgi:phytoene synthase
VRYWSWLFAAPSAREPLLALYALTAEWRALTDPASEVSAAQIKLTWWHDEVERLIAGAPLHPITCHIAALPHAAMG